MQPLVGDWEAFSKYGDALHNMSRCLREVAYEVQAHTLDLDRGWDGNAADAAYLYYSDTAASLSAHTVVIDKAGTNYQKLALDIWHSAEQAKGLLQTAGDQALLALVYAAAGTAAIETGVGAVLGYALAAMQVAKVIETVVQASKIAQAANLLIATFTSSLLGIFGELGDLGPIPAPATAYSHPMVKS